MFSRVAVFAAALYLLAWRVHQAPCSLHIRSCDVPNNNFYIWTHTRQLFIQEIWSFCECVLEWTRFTIVTHPLQFAFIWICYFCHYILTNFRHIKGCKDKSDPCQYNTDKSRGKSVQLAFEIIINNMIILLITSTLSIKGTTFLQ